MLSTDILTQFRDRGHLMENVLHNNLVRRGFIITIIFMVVFGFLSKEEKRSYPTEGGSVAW